MLQQQASDVTVTLCSVGADASAQICSSFLLVGTCETFLQSSVVLHAVGMCTSTPDSKQTALCIPFCSGQGPLAGPAACKACESGSTASTTSCHTLEVCSGSLLSFCSAEGIAAAAEKHRHTYSIATVTVVLWQLADISVWYAGQGVAVIAHQQRQRAAPSAMMLCMSRAAVRKLSSVMWSLW